jgi:hypothetical protein
MMMNCHGAQAEVYLVVLLFINSTRIKVVPLHAADLYAFHGQRAGHVC